MLFLGRGNLYQAVNVRKMMDYFNYIHKMISDKNESLYEDEIEPFPNTYIKLSGWYSYAYKDKHLLSVILENKKG